MPPSEYAELDDLILNAAPSEGWCEFNLGSIPVFGTRSTKGDPSLRIPHTDGDLPMDVHLAPLTFTLLGKIYGDFTTADVPVVGVGDRREQLAENAGALMALVKTRVTLTYHLYSKTFTGEVTVVDMQSSARDTDPPHCLAAAIRLHLPSGVMNEV